jgi:hypothetical protein
VRSRWHWRCWPGTRRPNSTGFERIISLDSFWANPPAIDPKSPSGYELGRRKLVLPYEGTDDDHWIRQTQQMFAEGQPRVRRVAYDNAPDGREVPWASPFRALRQPALARRGAIIIYASCCPTFWIDHGCAEQAQALLSSNL